ncbi:MAG: DUF349 domain-containing protein [Pseudarcicella sp.]|nr:DUF349 domain-containing protein [Pseudarcicella sp.]
MAITENENFASVPNGIISENTTSATIEENTSITTENITESSAEQIIDNSIVTNIEETNSHTETEVSKSDAGIDEQAKDLSELVSEHEPIVENIDFESLSREELANYTEKLLFQTKENISVASLRHSEDTLKVIKPIFEKFKATLYQEALGVFKASNEDSEEGFEFKHDTTTQKFDQNFKALKQLRSEYFLSIEKEKDKNLSEKTDILNRLRLLLEKENSNNQVAIKEGLAEFKKIQEDWKNAGNINSPHNATLWQTFHALVNRFHSNRSIYYELLDLDRKRNLQHKIELCKKIEKIAEATEIEPITSKQLNDAAAYFEEYKHIGPAPKEENELVWQRVKETIDILYNKRRAQIESGKAEAEQVLLLKTEIAKMVEPFLQFNSDSINEWNERTKVLQELQEQWNNVKGAMPREKGKELSDTFWGNIKIFFKNKGDFFKKLEAKRDNNLVSKKAIIEKIETYLSNNDTTPDATNTVIQLQKDFRTIGHVPEKYKESIYEHFKKVCDQFFDAKRNQSSEQEKEYEQNLIAKNNLLAEIVSEAKTGANLDKLAGFKTKWNAIGFVPRKNMQELNKKYIDTINQYVGSIATLSGKEIEQLHFKNEIDALKGGLGNSKDFVRKESDAQKKIQFLESEIALWENNLEFFSKSKNADKLKEEFNTKIKKAKAEIEQLKKQIKMIKEIEK